MSAEFTEFTQAVARKAGQSGESGATGNAGPTPDSLDRVAVLGGGPDACLLAALCLAENASVTLFSAYGAELDMLKASSGISLRGAGPVGTYQIDRESTPSITTTAELVRAVAEAEIVFLTGPLHKQRTYAMVLADHLSDGQILVLAPGRSLGALETAWLLRIGGCSADVTVIETQGLPFWYSTQGSVLTLSEAAPVTAATLPSGRLGALQQLKRFLPNLQATESVLWSGFADGSALVELPALLLNGPAFGSGAAAIPMGGQALPENATFASQIGPEQHAVIEKLAGERRRTGRAFGVRNLPDTDQWVSQHAGHAKGEGSRPIPDKPAAEALIRDGVIGSLVPLLSAATLAGISVPVTQSIVTLASTILGADVAAAGRRLDTIGIATDDIDTARRAMDKIALGSQRAETNVGNQHE